MWLLPFLWWSVLPPFVTHVYIIYTAHMQHTCTGSFVAIPTEFCQFHLPLHGWVQAYNTQMAYALMDAENVYSHFKVLVPIAHCTLQSLT